MKHTAATQYNTNMHKVMLSYHQAIRTTTISSSSTFIHQHQLHHQLARRLHLSSQNEQQVDIDITNTRTTTYFCNNNNAKRYKEGESTN